jgi:2-polyprenyl-6-hydroxyphenyl methylase/3-demethylubiquinone-9 3-methyltransferase
VAGPRIELDTDDPDAIDGRELRAVAFQDVRLQYVRRVLPEAARHALVVGSGRGRLARGLAGLGLDVVAVDPSATATGLARAADTAGVAHHTAAPESLPCPDHAFDLVYCADTLETTPDLDGVIREAARVLRPDGVLVYDTVNRTLPGRLVYLVAFQRLPFTRIMPPDRYRADRLRRPGELATVLAAHGLTNQDVCGFKPRSIPGLVNTILRRRRGTITDDEAGSLAGFVLDPKGPPVVTYLGHARR